MWMRVAIAGGPPLSDMFYILRRAGPGGAALDEMGRSTLSQAVFHVPAGGYRLTARHGLANIDIPVSVERGHRKPGRRGDEQRHSGSFRPRRPMAVR